MYDKENRSVKYNVMANFNYVFEEHKQHFQNSKVMFSISLKETTKY